MRIAQKVIQTTVSGEFLGLEDEDSCFVTSPKILLT